MFIKYLYMQKLDVRQKGVKGRNVFTEEDEMLATIELHVATVTYAKFERSVKK